MTEGRRMIGRDRPGGVMSRKPSRRNVDTEPMYV